MKSDWAPIIVPSLPSEKVWDLLFGSVRLKRRIVRAINGAVAKMEKGSLDTCPVPDESTQSEVKLEAPTHEFVQKGERWGRRRKKGFELW